MTTQYITGNTTLDPTADTLSIDASAGNIVLTYPLTAKDKSYNIIRTDNTSNKISFNDQIRNNVSYLRVNEMSIPWYNAATNSYISITTTGTKAVNDIYYSGSNYYGSSPSLLAVVASTNLSNSNGGYDFILQDLTNNLEVARITARSITTIPTLSSTTTFSNISANPAIWELRVVGRGASGTSNTSTNLYSCYIRFT